MTLTTINLLYWWLCVIFYSLYFSMANLTTDGKLCIEREIGVQIIEKDETEINSRYSIAETCNWINSNKYTKVCLQFPDELLGISSKVYEELKKGTEADLYILGDTSYASCCADVVASMHVQSNAIVHYGHTCFSKTNIPVYIVLNQKSLDIDYTFKILRENFTDCNKKLCLFYDCEFNHLKDNLTEKWFQQYPISYIASISMKDSLNRFFGRVVENLSNEEYSSEVLKDCVCIYVGSRGRTLFNFAVSVTAEKWYLLDPVSNQLDVIQESVWFKRRRFLIEKCKDANVVGILVCNLAGDQTKQIISRMKQLCKANGKKCYIVSVGKPNVAKLANFPEIDIYVMIACPENDLYDSRDFYQPIVYPYELEVALNTNRDVYFTSHITNYEELLPGNKHYKDINDIYDSTDVSLITGKIREIKVTQSSSSTDLVEKQNWQLENIGQSLNNRSWKGLEQNLGESDVKQVEEGRKGIPLQYLNEPE